MRNGGVSLWWQQVGLPSPTDRLQGDTSCDVAIVGGGLTGLWTAYYIAEADPTLDVRVVEAEFAGFGASGRNGGFLLAGLAEAQGLEAAAEAERIRLVEGARAEAEQQRAAIYRDMPPAVLLGLAAREFAGKLDTIEHLNVTPDLLAAALGEFRRAVPLPAATR